MKKTLLLILVLFYLQGCNLHSEYSKNDALVQSYECLKIKNELGVTSNVRNPYLKKLAEILQRDSIPNEKITDSITILSNEIKSQIKNGKELIVNLKPKHSDTRFFDATIEYLNLNEKLEDKTQLLFQSLINPNSDKNKEIMLGEEVDVLAQKVLTEQTEYKTKESKFHNDNNIVQREVDSIVKSIENK